MKSTVLYVTATFTIALGFSGDSVVENPFANAEDMGVNRHEVPVLKAIGRGVPLSFSQQYSAGSCFHARNTS